MPPAPSLQDSVTAPVRQVASAALRTLAVAGDLLAEAARTLPPGVRTGGLQEAVVAVRERVPLLEDTQRGVVDAVFVACDLAQVCDAVASRHRQTSPAALGCARLAEAAARLAVEAVTEDRGWTGAQALSRRARQVGEIQEVRERLDAIVATIDLNRVEGTPEGHLFRGGVRRLIDGAATERRRA